MIELITVAFASGLVGGFAGYYLRRSPPVTIPRAFTGTGIDVAEEMERYSKMSARDIIRERAQTGREATELLAKLNPSLQMQYEGVIRRLANLQGTTTEHELLILAGYVQALISLHDGLQGKSVDGEIARSQLLNRDVEFSEVPRA